MDDLIRRKDVMLALEKCHKQCYKEDDWGDEWIHYETTENEMECIPSAQPEQQWIPVSERLPEEETDVLICNIDGDIEISRGSYSTEIKDHFMWYTSGWRFGDVIAWMPLPQPYNEVK